MYVVNIAHYYKRRGRVEGVVGGLSKPAVPSL